jgi:hypothetical protein
MLKNYIPILLFSFLLAFVSCNDPEDENPLGIILLSDFDNGPQGWTPFFTGLPSDAAATYALSVDLTELPPELGESSRGLQIKGSNKGNALFFFMKKELENLSPGRLYGLRFRVEMATNEPRPVPEVNRVANAGDPAIMLAGGMAFEPGVSVTTQSDGSIKANFGHDVDLLDNGSRTEDVMVLGLIHHEGEAQEFRMIRLENFDEPFEVRATPQGNLWVVFGFKVTSQKDFEIFLKSTRILINEL